MKNIYFSVLISLSCFVFLNGQTSDNPWAISIGANLVSVQEDAVDSKIGFGVPAVSLSRYIAGGFSIGAQYSLNSVEVDNADLDYAAIEAILKYNLSNEGYQISTAKDGEIAIQKAREIEPNLIIMDIMMPNMDGIETCEILRSDDSFNDTLIMFLTARGEDYSQVAAFEAGADDYITKPIKPRVLNSKVKALLRRFKNEFSQILSFKNIVIDSEQYTVLVDNKTHDLPRKEFELLFLLASKPGKVFKRERIMESVWGTDVIVGDRTIDVHIRKLREKIGKNLFKTIKGVGYQFVINE